MNPTEGRTEGPTEKPTEGPTDVRGRGPGPVSSPHLTAPAADHRPPGRSRTPAGVCVAATLLLLAGLSLFPVAGQAQAKLKIGFDLVAKVKGPTAVVAAPGHKKVIFVTQRTGKIRAIRQGRPLPKPFLDISDLVGSLRIEQGLLGLAFPPDYQKTGHFYVDYTDRKGDIRIDQFTRNPKKPLQSSEKSRRPVLRIPRVSQGGSHNGGAIRFLGGLLYIAVGDGNDPGDSLNLAQNLHSLRGKILRIDPRADQTSGRTYRIPRSNPFAGGPGRGEVFAYGLRNPHAFSFHRPAGGELEMTITDVGQQRFEEINNLPFRLAWGANFGWKIYEGVMPYDCDRELCPAGLPVADPPDVVWPVLTYSHSRGCAVIGGPVVRDPALSKIRGRIIYGDFCSNRVRTALPDDQWITDDRSLGSAMPPGRGRHTALNGIGEDGWGRVYLFSNLGEIYRLEQKAVPAKKTEKKTTKK
ncbi:MAG: sorbosone dehydrogenase family protein [Acidobacteriota bacterium]